MITNNKFIKQNQIFPYEDLLSLVKGEILAIQINNYYALEKCERLAILIQQAMGEFGYSISEIYESEVNSFWSTIGKQALRQEYFTNAVPAMRNSRQLMDHLSPTDQLRLELDETWPAGAHLMHVNGKPMHFGMTRRWKEGTEALPHQDVFWRETDDQFNFGKQISQLGANIYLTCCEEGGELEIWDYTISDEIYDNTLADVVKNSYGFHRSNLPPSAVCITPQVGDLILLNTTFVHAVKKVIKGHRVTVSGHIGYWGEDQPLRLWS